MPILFDSTKSRKSANFGRGLLRYVPSSPTPNFEPSAQDREWWAREYADRYEWSTAELNHIEKTAGRIANALEATRVYVRRIDAILNGEPEERLGADYGVWLDRLEWKRRMDDAYSGCEFEPKSTPISDDDINIVNVAG